MGSAAAMGFLPGWVAALLRAIDAGDPDATEQAILAAAECRACRAALTRLVRDESRPLELRVAAARALLRGGTARGTAAVLEELERARLQGDEATRAKCRQDKRQELSRPGE